MVSEKRIEIYNNEAEVIRALCKHIEEISKEAIQEKDYFTVGVSGGSLVNALAKGLPIVQTDWFKWRLYFCDERCVPFDDAESTFGAYRKALNSAHVPIADAQFRKINPSLPAEIAAKVYFRTVESDFGPKTLPRFDLLLLGMGPDGHTCSLFPGHPLLKETRLWIAPITDSPKPPSSRVTLTYPVLNNAKNCIFSIWGAGKADMVKRILKDKEDLPAGKVHPTNGLVYWLLDEAAASKLNDNV